MRPVHVRDRPWRASVVKRGHAVFCLVLTCYIPHTKKKYGLLVKKSSIPNAGDGLYALKEFKQGDFIADYKGEVLTKAQRNERYGHTNKDLAPYAFQASQNKIILDNACHRYIGAYANSKPNHN